MHHATLVRAHEFDLTFLKEQNGLKMFFKEFWMLSSGH